ncbi:NEDD4-like E3 ubiquitin-protein ligase (WWP1) [Vairimorpha necatrix]|uniref:HECT-type E3 ubiquitin transferase n=1 Tax=Vairimorpha necatrix TaxID=6039 RepID=A0AAX4J9N4_9MICR
MKLIFSRIQLKQKGWFSWLFNKHFKLKINNKSFKLKTGNMFLFYIIDIPSFDVNIKIDLDNILYDYSKTVHLGHSFIEVDNSCFKGFLYFNIVHGNLMTHLENEFSKLNVKALSRNLHNCTDIYTVRESYEDFKYYVNKENYTTSLSKSLSNAVLPTGWDTTVFKNKILYINNNLRLCYWKSPGFFYNALRDKIDHFENILLNLNYISFRNLIPLKLDVKRDHILDSTAFYILQNQDKLRTKKIYVSFVDEMGQDYGALLREFIYETSLEILNDRRLKFTEDFLDVNPENDCKEDLIKFTVKEIGLRQVFFEDFPEDLKGKNRLNDECFFTYLGVFLAFLIISNENIEYSFSLSFYENLLKRNFNLRLIQEVQYQKSLSWMLKNEVTGDLLPGVTDTNKAELIYSIYYDKLFLQKKIPYEYIYKGFYSVIPEEFRDMFENDEFSVLVSNERTLDINNLKEFVLYNMCAEDTDEVQWLWEILKTRDQVFIRKFLKFITGSGSIPMLLNHSSFRIVIEMTNSNDILFRASACLNKLFIGRYKDKKSMEDILDFSILNTEGFHKI